MLKWKMRARAPPSISSLFYDVRLMDLLYIKLLAERQIELEQTPFVTPICHNNNVKDPVRAWWQKCWFFCQWISAKNYQQNPEYLPDTTIKVQHKKCAKLFPQCVKLFLGHLWPQSLRGDFLPPNWVTDMTSTAGNLRGLEHLLSNCDTTFL